MASVDTEDLTREEHIQIIMKVTGEPHDVAEFIYAIEMGEVDGDIEVVDA